MRRVALPTPTVDEDRTRDFSLTVDPTQFVSSRTRICLAPIAQQGAFPMLDILMLALSFGLFALAIGYTYACERL